MVRPAWRSRATWRAAGPRWSRSGDSGTTCWPAPRARASPGWWPSWAGPTGGGGERARVELTEPCRECERIPWSQARTFAYGIRLLPPAKRRGLAAIYAFARRIDDIGDGTSPAEQNTGSLRQAP